MPRHHRQQGREGTDNAGGRHMRVRGSRPAVLLQGNHFPGGEGKALDCVLVFSGAADG